MSGLAVDLAEILRRAEPHFSSEELPPELSAAQARLRLAEAGAPAPAFVLASGRRLILLRLRDGAGLDAPAPLRRLDVAVLHGLVLERLLGLDRAAQEKKENVRYLKDAQGALDEARTGTAQAVFLLNPTPVGALREVAQAGLVMPQKSTFFFPKLASGLVLAPFSPAEPL
ncbi:MAG: hypothetical protein NVS4B10_25100 [Myxococcales bacterium]